jgi:hypothetical protein
MRLGVPEYELGSLSCSTNYKARLEATEDERVIIQERSTQSINGNNILCWVGSEEKDHHR